MYSSSAPGSARRGGNPAVNVPPPQIRGAPNPSNMPPMNSGSTASSRVSDILDQVKAEYEAAIQQLNIAKMEQLEMERKIQSQIVEMDQFQQTLKTLESNHRRIRQQYEDDIMRMRRQLEATSNRQSGGTRPGSPLRVLPAQPSSRLLPQAHQNSQQGASASPALSTLDANSLSGRRVGPIPSLNRDQKLPEVSNGKGESRGLSNSGNRSSASSPVAKKHKQVDTAVLSNGKSSLISVSNSSVASNSSTTSVLKLHSHHKNLNDQGSEESSPSSNNSIPSISGSGIAPAGTSSAAKQQNPNNTSISTNAAFSSSASSTQKSLKASKLSWNCVYSSKSSGAYQDTERPAAEMHQSMDHQSVVCCVRFSSDGSMMASGCHKTAQVFDVKTGERKFMVSRPAGNTSECSNSNNSEGEDAYVRAVCFSPDCTKLVAGMPQNTIRIWNIETNEEGPALTGHESEIYSLDYVNDLIVSGSGDRKIRLWDARSGRCENIFGSESGGPSDGVTSVALSPDGRLLAAASLDKIVRIWDTETSQILDRLEGHSDSVYSIAFSPDGKNVISGSLDRNIMLWDVGAQGRTTTRPRMLFQGHKDFVLSVAYTPDGRWLMSGSKDRSVVFWDPRSSRSVLTLTGYRNSVISVASSPASPYFATGSGDCFAVIWNYQCQTF